MSSSGKHPNQVATQFKPGQSGNPGGAVKGYRKHLNAKFLEALAKDFDEYGEDAIIRARAEDPVGYMKVVAGLLPKQIEAATPLDDVTDAELIAGIALLRARLAQGSGSGTSAPGEPSQTH